MSCNVELLSPILLFAQLNDEERAVLADNVELRKFAANQKIYKQGDVGGLAFVMLSGKVLVTTIDEDRNEVVIDEPKEGEFFGFASMLEGSPHQTSAMAHEPTECIEIDRKDINALLSARPGAGMHLLTALGRQLHASQNLVRARATRNANEMIDEKETFGERVADAVARFGGSWRFIISFGVVLVTYTATNIILGGRAWDPYPFILLNLFLSMLASIQAPVIMMSQNRQDAKDRVRAELDYKVNLKAEMEVAQLLEKVRVIEQRLDDMDGRP